MQTISKTTTSLAIALAAMVMTVNTSPANAANPKDFAQVSNAAPAAQAPVTRDLTVIQRPLANMQIPVSDLKVTAWVDHQDNTYGFGEKVQLSVKANKDAYITIIDVGTSGKVHIIFPNQYQTNNRVKANQVVNIPSASAKFDLNVSPPAGTELIKIIATTGATELIPANVLSPAGPFKAVGKSTTNIAKDIEVVARQDTKNQWADYDKVIKIVDHGAVQATQGGNRIAGAAPVAAPAAVATGGTFNPATVQQVNAAPFQLHLRTEKSVYKIGEKVRVMATPEKDCHLTLIDVGTSGNVMVLFPNRYQQDNLVRAAQTVVIPSDTAAVDYKLGGPTGVEAVIGICRTDNGPVYNGVYDFQQNAYQPWGTAKSLAKDLAVELRQPNNAIAHTATTFLVVN